MSKKFPSSYLGGKNFMNDFFDKIYIINLESSIKKIKTVSKQFRVNEIKYDRFIAIDGRCEKRKCRKKKRELEEYYGVTISISLPTASLVIGTIQMLREMIRNNWEYILICEDDINLTPDIIKKFKKGIKEIEDIDWDLLYLGSGGSTGFDGISFEKTKDNKYLTGWNDSDPDLEFYVAHRDDLRIPCEKGECKIVSDNITRSWNAGGNWCYAYSLKGAKKTLKLIGNNIDDHIDQLLMKYQSENKLKALCFDPPIVYHEHISLRSKNSTLDW
jgi:GR25 family glycosyltransferase involved in LPS biosynthesis